MDIWSYGYSTLGTEKEFTSTVVNEPSMYVFIILHDVTWANQGIYIDFDVFILIPPCHAGVLLCCFFYSPVGNYNCDFLIS